MSSGPSPSIHYTTLVELRPSPDGGFLSSGGAPEAGGYTLSEAASTGPGDNIGVLGDTPQERVNLIQPDGSAYPKNLFYYGKITNGDAIVSFPADEPSKPAGTQVYLLLTNGTYKFNDEFPASSVSQSSLVLCFGSGTHILTTRGEVTVEDLRIGDTAITASGQPRTITWTGHRTLSADTALPVDKAPVRIAPAPSATDGPPATCSSPPAIPSSSAPMPTDRAACSCRS